MSRNGANFWLISYRVRHSSRTPQGWNESRERDVVEITDCTAAQVVATLKAEAIRLRDLPREQVKGHMSCDEVVRVYSCIKIGKHELTVEEQELLS